MKMITGMPNGVLHGPSWRPDGMRKGSSNSWVAGSSLNHSRVDTMHLILNSKLVVQVQIGSDRFRTCEQPILWNHCTIALSLLISWAASTSLAPLFGSCWLWPSSCPSWCMTWRPRICLAVITVYGFAWTFELFQLRCGDVPSKELANLPSSHFLKHCLAGGDANVPPTLCYPKSFGGNLCFLQASTIRGTGIYWNHGG